MIFIFVKFWLRRVFIDNEIKNDFLLTFYIAFVQLLIKILWFFFNLNFLDY